MITMTTDYLQNCIYFEIYDEINKIMNYYMFVNYRWIRGDDNRAFTPEEMKSHLNLLFSIKDRKMIFKFYGKDCKTVVLNG